MWLFRIYMYMHLYTWYWDLMNNNPFCLILCNCLIKWFYYSKVSNCICTCNISWNNKRPSGTFIMISCFMPSFKISKYMYQYIITCTAIRHMLNFNIINTLWTTVFDWWFITDYQEVYQQLYEYKPSNLYHIIFEWRSI